MMKQKNLFYLLTCCALFFVTFTACNDDDKTDIPPVEVVTDLAFTNTSQDSRQISGPLAWNLPSPEGDITGYAIYLSDSATARDKALAIVPKGTTSFDVPAGTDYYPWLVVVAVNAFGESNNQAGISVDAYQREGIYILNAGNWQENNASLSFFDINTGTMTGNLYSTANGSGLGDSAEQILIYGSKIYITVTGSNRLVVLDKDQKLLKSINPIAGNPLNPRRMTAHDGKIYFTCFDGHQAAKLDTASLTVEKMVKVGRYPEQLAVANGKLYVANSGGVDFPNYGKTVSVIDLASFEVEKAIEVELNPVCLAADSQGDVYVISKGDYNTVKNTLQRIDGQTGEVSVIDYGTQMTMTKDKLYYIYAQDGSQDIKYKIYDALTEKIVSDKFIVNDIKIASPEAIAVDPATGKIYITSAPWGETSELFIFSADGKLDRGSMDTKGYYAKGLAFWSK